MAAVFSVISFGCGDDPGGVQALCDTSANCESGLICAQSGPAKGTCTSECEDYDECRLRHGESFGCLEGACIEFCSAGSCVDVTPGGCADGLHCFLYSGQSCTPIGASICVR